VKSNGLSHFRLKCCRGLGFILGKRTKVNKKMHSKLDEKKHLEGKFCAKVND